MYNVMIVDDEPVIKKGLICFVNWEALDCRVVCDAGNGIEAKEKLSSHDVHIVVTDIKMPGMDGLDLSKFIHENYPAIKVIILTAFADFSYAQTAIKYNVVDFVIKSNPTKKIPDAINKAKALIMQEKEKEQRLRQLEEKISNNLSEIREKFFKDVFNGIIANDVIIQNKMIELEIKLENYFVLIFDIIGIPTESTENSSRGYNKFIFLMKNFLSTAFKNYYHYTVAANKDLIAVIVSFKNSNAPLYTRTILTTCDEILSMAESFMPFTINIGISRMHQNVRDLALVCQEAKEALQDSFYNNNHVSVYVTRTDTVSASTCQPLDFAEKITDNLQHGNPAKALQNLESLLDAYRDNKEPIENVKVSCILIASYCFRLLSSYNLFSPEFTNGKSDIYKQIQASKNAQNLSVILSQLIKKIAQVIENSSKQYNYLVREAQKFIRDNFSMNINLQSIADHIHVNSSYLSRLYKKETGESIVDAINRYRIEIAQKLLKDPASKVFEVAIAVGINNPSYFTHVFTRYVGMSPKEYKANYSN